MNNSQTFANKNHQSLYLPIEEAVANTNSTV